MSLSDQRGKEEDDLRIYAQDLTYVCHPSKLPC